jgi:hypothetical protein
MAKLEFDTLLWAGNAESHPSHSSKLLTRTMPFTWAISVQELSRLEFTGELYWAEL